MLHCAKATQHFIALLSDDCEETVDCSVTLYTACPFCWRRYNTWFLRSTLKSRNFRLQCFISWKDTALLLYWGNTLQCWIVGTGRAIPLFGNSLYCWGRCYNTAVSGLANTYIVKREEQCIADGPEDGSRKESVFPKRSEATTTKTTRMGSKVLAALVTILVVVEAARIRRESGDCDKITLEHQECVKVWVQIMIRFKTPFWFEKYKSAWNAMNYILLDLGLSW